MRTDYVTDSAETLAEDLWRADAFVHGIEEGTRGQFEDDPDRDSYRAQAAALIDSATVRPAAEARAEALREAADQVAGALMNEVGSGHTSTYSVRRWLRDRAALVEEDQ